MSIVLITGSAGLIGSEATRFFHERGFDIVGVDNNMREYFFGADGSTTWNRAQLESGLANYRHRAVDIRNRCEEKTNFHLLRIEGGNLIAKFGK